MQLYNLEGQPMEVIPDGSPIPPGRWPTPTGGAQWQAGNATVNASPSIPFGLAQNNPPISMGTNPGPAPTSQIPSWITALLNSFNAQNPANPVASPPSSGTPTGVPTNSGGAVGGAGTPNGFPADRNLLSEGGKTLADLISLMPSWQQAYAQFSGQQAGTDLSNLHNTLFGNFDAQMFDAAHPGFLQSFQQQQAAGQLQGWTPQQYAAAYAGLPANDPSLNQYYSGGINSINQFLTQQANQQTAAANTSLRQANINDIGTMGGQLSGYWSALNPKLMSSLQQSQVLAQNGIGQSPYQQQLGSMFNAGPQYTNVSPGTVTGQQIGASQIGGYSQVNAPNNPFLGFAQNQAQNQSSSGSPLGQSLADLAQQQLGLGSSLSAQDLNTAQQAAREAWGARGLINSPGAVGAEILNANQLGQQRLMERAGLAENVNAQLQNQQGLNSQYTLGVLGAGSAQNAQGLQAALANQQAGLNVAQLNQAAQQQAALANQANQYQTGYANAALSLQGQLANQQTGLQAQQQNYGLGTTLAGLDYGQQQQNFANVQANANLQSANQFNPFGTITGWGSANQGTNPTLFGMGSTTTSGAAGNQNVFSALNPFNSYASDLYNTNYNAAVSQYLNAQNNAAANSASNNSLFGSGLGALGALAGGLFQGAGAAGSVKKLFGCIPEGERIDTPRGPRRVEELHAGDLVIGFDGGEERIVMKHEYAEDVKRDRFYRFTLDDGSRLALSDMHRIGGIAAREYETGSFMGGKRIVAIKRFGGVSRSYDLLTTSDGYQMAGVPVNSMIQEMASATSAMQEVH